MTQTETSPSLEERILDLSRRGKVSQVENAWLELNEDPPLAPRFYGELVVALTQGKAKGAALGLILMTLDELEKKGEWRAINRIVSKVARAWPDDEDLRTYAQKALKEQFKDMDSFDAIYDACKIDSDLPVNKALNRFRFFLRLTPGRVYQHSTWGEGIVREMELDARKATFDFPQEGEKVLTFEGVKNFLVYLPPNHFLSRRAKEPDKLQTMSEESPVEVIKLALQSNEGLLKQAELKSLLIGTIVPEKSWTSWWTKARKHVRLDPLVDLDATGGAHAEIHLRTRPKSFEEEIEEIFFDTSSDLVDRAEAVNNLVKESANITPPNDLLTKMLTQLDQDYGREETPSLSRSIEYAILAEDIVGLGDGLEAKPAAIPPAANLVNEITDYEQLAEFETVEYAMRVLKLLIKRDGDKGVTKAVNMLPNAQVRVAQAIWKEMDAEKHLDQAVAGIEKILQHPTSNPDTYVWVVRSIADGGWSHLDDYFPITRLVPELLDGLENWQMIAENPSTDKTLAATCRSLIQKARALLQSAQFSVICKCAEQMTLEQVQRLVRTIQLNAALNDIFKSGAIRALRLTRRDLEEPAAEDATPDFYYATGKARAEKIKENAWLTSVAIPENSQEIETARQEGDLKENAGYHAAKDKQKMLQQRALALTQALSAARVLTEKDVNTDIVGFGTRFVARNAATAEEETYTVLGRWEANAKKNILSYLAPMMQQFLEKRPGDEVTIKHPGGGETKYKLLSIENALADGSWDEDKAEDVEFE